MSTEPSSPDPNFSNLRGVRWRMGLGILPPSPPASIEELRRVAADSRRRYASLRRRLLVDPHLPKDGTRSPDLTVDNPLSQNPGIFAHFRARTLKRRGVVSVSCLDTTQTLVSFKDAHPEDLIRILP